jgi:hypothetical protein
VNHYYNMRTLILLVIGATILWLVLRSLRAMRLKERYALLMLGVGLPFVLLALWPDAVVFLSGALSIEKPTFLVLGLTVFVVLIIFELLSIVSVQERKITALAQIVGILSQKQREMELREKQSQRGADEVKERTSDQDGAE